MVCGERSEAIEAEAGSLIQLPPCRPGERQRLELQGDSWFPVPQLTDPQSPRREIWRLLPAVSVDFLVQVPRHSELPETAPEITLEPSAPSTETHRSTASEALIQSQLTGRCEALAFEPAGFTAEELSADSFFVRCRAPIGTYHLRLKVPGFASLFLWNQELPGSADSLGPFSLTPGSSLVGRAQLEADSDCSQLRCEAEIEPLALTALDFAALNRRGEGAPTLQRNLQTIQPDGFFQLTGLTPGQARLRVRAEGFAPAPPLTVELRPGLETTLLDPVILRPPVTTRFAITPPVDPKRQPWTLYLRSVEDSRAAPRRAETDAEGVATFRDLPAGQYRYSVESDNDRWAHGEIELAAGSEAIEIEVPWIFVEGTVTSEDEPVHAKLWFGQRSAPLRHFVDTGDDGTYRIALSRAGLWPLGVELPHLIVRGTPTTFNTLAIEVPWVPPGETANLDIGLPSGRLLGRILGPEERIVDCDVTLQRDVLGEFDPADAAALRPAMASARTNLEGEFQLEYLSTGNARVTARCPAGTTSTAEVKIVDGETVGPLLLELPSVKGLSGRVLGPLGPVAGAAVFAWPQPEADSPRPVASHSNITTDLQGQFEIPSMGGVQRFAMVVQAPGLAARILDAPTTGEITVDLAQDGARLVLEMPEGSSPWIHHQGTTALAQILVLWPPAGSRRESTQPSTANESEAQDKLWQRWTIPSLAAGAYEICFGPGPLDDCRSLLLAPGATSTLVR